MHALRTAPAEQVAMTKTHGRSPVADVLADIAALRAAKTDASTNPTEFGWYVCWLHLGSKPVVLYWGERTTRWQYGATVMPVVAYMGPLPE